MNDGEWPVPRVPARGLSLEYQPRRIVPCVCGGFLEALVNQRQSIELAVRTHQKTLRHQAWREARER
jgi:hypothetical protein